VTGPQQDQQGYFSGLSIASMEVKDTVSPCGCIHSFGKILCQDFVLGDLLHASLQHMSYLPQACVEHGACHKVVLSVVQVKVGLKEGAQGRSEHLLRLGSALDVNRKHLLACSSAQEGIDRSQISPGPDLAERAAQALHDSPDSMHSQGAPAVVPPRNEVPVMLRRQLADDPAAQQPDEATLLGAFQWDRLQQHHSDNVSAYETASTAESGASAPVQGLRHC